MIFFSKIEPSADLLRQRASEWVEAEEKRRRDRFNDSWVYKIIGLFSAGALGTGVMASLLPPLTIVPLVVSGAVVIGTLLRFEAKVSPKSLLQERNLEIDELQMKGLAS